MRFAFARGKPSDLYSRSAHLHRALRKRPRGPAADTGRRRRRGENSTLCGLRSLGGIGAGWDRAGISLGKGHLPMRVPAMLEFLHQNIDIS